MRISNFDLRLTFFYILKKLDVIGGISIIYLYDWYNSANRIKENRTTTNCSQVINI